MGGTGNGTLLGLGTDSGFDALLTADRGFARPQSLDKLPLPIVILLAESNRPDDLRPLVPKVTCVLSGMLQRRVYHVSTETLMADCAPPASPRTVRPRLCSPPANIERLAELVAQAANPMVLTEAAGRETETCEALVALAERATLPVVERSTMLFPYFPKNHPLHQGPDLDALGNDADLVILMRTRVPWYPPSAAPPGAVIVVFDEKPHRDSMVYQSLQTDIYPEDNVAQTLCDLADALDRVGLDDAAVAYRRSRLARIHADHGAARI